MTNAKNDTKVFIAGSRCLSKLSQEIKRRIDNIVEKHLTIIIGDANGADKAVQQYLYTKTYSDVVVFCSSPERRFWAARRSAEKLCDYFRIAASKPFSSGLANGSAPKLNSLPSLVVSRGLTNRGIV